MFTTAIFHKIAHGGKFGRAFRTGLFCHWWSVVLGIVLGVRYAMCFRVLIAGVAFFWFCLQ
jgi:hypothetical protein